MDEAEVVVIGTIHGQHNSNERYSAQVLENILLALEPDAILVELPPEIGGRPTIVRGRVANWLTSPENLVANAVGHELGIPILPFDRPGRNEIYKETRYFERQERASSLRRKWIDELAAQDPDSLESLIFSRIARDAGTLQGSLSSSADPRVINSEAADAAIRIYRRLWDEVALRLLESRPEYAELVEDTHFFRDLWRERNEIMAGNILQIAEERRGQRLVVLTGWFHRSFLLELLRGKDSVTLKEFWEVLEV